MNLVSLGKILIVVAMILLLIGVAFYLIGRLGVTKVPGDIIFKKGGVIIFIPVVTAILISALITLLLNLYLFVAKK